MTNTKILSLLAGLFLGCLVILVSIVAILAIKELHDEKSVAEKSAIQEPLDLYTTKDLGREDLVVEKDGQIFIVYNKLIVQRYGTKGVSIVLSNRDNKSFEPRETSFVFVDIVNERDNPKKYHATLKKFALGENINFEE